MIFISSLIQGRVFALMPLNSGFTKRSPALVANPPAIIIASGFNRLIKVLIPTARCEQINGAEIAAIIDKSEEEGENWRIALVWPITVR